MAAGIHILEYASDPTLPSNTNPVLADQYVTCGPSPSASAAFTQATQFIEVILGTNKGHGAAANDGSAVHYLVGLDPVATLTTQLQLGQLGSTYVQVADSSRLSIPVGHGSRIGFVSEGV